MTLQITCSSRIEAVTVYERGALVTRSIELPEVLEEGLVELIVAGITDWAEAGAARAHADGDRSVLSVRAERAYPTQIEKDETLGAQLRRAQQQRALLQAQLTSLQQQRGTLRTATPTLRLQPRIGRAVDPVSRTQDALSAAMLVDALVASLDEQSNVLVAQLRSIDETLRTLQTQTAQAVNAERERIAPASWSFVLRLASSGALRALRLVYPVAPARWWPAHTVRLSEEATKARWELGGFVAQRTGEDWKGVRVTLSTASLTSDAQLPELPSLRLGKSQKKVRKGYRPPPEGLSVLFAGFDGVAAPPEPTPEAPTQLYGAIDVLTKEAKPTGGKGKSAHFEADRKVSTRNKHEEAKEDYQSSGEILSEIVDEESRQPSRQLRAEQNIGGDEGGYAEDKKVPEPEKPAVTSDGFSAWLDFDALLLGGATDGVYRGKLRSDPQRLRAPSGSQQQQLGILEQTTGPLFTSDPRTRRGNFDHQYEATGLNDVPSNGVPHRVELLSAETKAAILLRATPREAAEVYREVELKNPFDAPLLAGPVEVFVDQNLLATSSIAAVDRGGTFTTGLGLEERVRVARNVRMEESTVGLLKGATVLDHTVQIEVSSSLSKPMIIEVLDRVPQSQEEHIAVETLQSEPRAESYDQTERGVPIRGGLRWRLVLSAGGKLKLSHRFRITLPSKNELIGGNRRD